MQTNDEILGLFERTMEQIHGNLGSVVGINQVTKAIERQTAKLVIIAEDTNPQEIVLHVPTLCKDRGIVAIVVRTKKDVAHYLRLAEDRKSSCGAITKLADPRDDELLQKLVTELRQ